MGRWLVSFAAAAWLAAPPAGAQDSPATSLIGEDFTALPPAAACPPIGAAPSGPAPDPRCVLGKLPLISTSTYRVDASGDLPRGRYTSTTGPCILVTATNVKISGSEIGPCGAASETGKYGYGIEISDPGTGTLPGNIEISRNVIHDVATGVLSHVGRHPIVIDRNTFFNVRQTEYKSHLVQLSNVSGGSGASRITCNVSDGYMRYPALVGPQYVDDHINLYGVLGASAATPVEIAYNKIRGMIGGGMQTGSGIMVGDGPASGGGENGFFSVHDNIIVQVNNTGIGVAGGHDIAVAGNWVDQRGPSAASMTGWPLVVKNHSASWACNNVSYTGNRLTPANLWSYPPSTGYPGMVVKGLLNAGGCTNVQWSTANNAVDDAELGQANAAEGSQLTFQTVIGACQ